MLAVPARRLVSGATDRRFDALETGLSQILTRIAEMEQLMVRAEAEAAALRQQADETLAFLRVQHDITRDLLEELRPVLDRSRGVD
jgi:hypothetical protein